MDTVAGFPLFPVHVDRDAELVDPGEAEALLSHLDESSPSDLLVVSHGWNNDLAEARSLYEKLLTSLRELVEAGRAPGVPTDLPILALFWPSKRFAQPELIAGGAAAAGGDLRESELERALADLAETLGDEDRARLEHARDLIADLDERAVQDEFVEALRGVIPADGDGDPEDAVRHFGPGSGREVLQKLEAPPLPAAPPSQGGAAAVGLGGEGPRDGAGGAAGLGDVFRGIRAAALRLANLTTYYVMKRRAGTIGRDALAPLLDRISDDHPDLRVHLVGHSFGGRLVTAAAGATAAPVQSLVLLQAAFSHNGFAEDFDGTRDGAFRGVVTDEKVRGPVLITHTAADRAVGYAYPIASRLAGQDAAGLGGPDDRFGGIGRNGAQHTPEAVRERLELAGHPYTFRPGVVHNLLADGHIANHSDVHGPEVAAALAAAVALP